MRLTVTVYRFYGGAGGRGAHPAATIRRVQIRRSPSPRLGRGSRIARAAVALSIALLALALVGCGLASDHGSSVVSLTVTRDFGARRVGQVSQAAAGGSETVLGLLQRRFAVQLNRDTVVAINGVRAQPGKSWFLFVNGSAIGIGSRKQRTPVHAGDRIWWDLHDTTATGHIPSVVGSFPEPFIHGLGGKRFPVTLECAPDVRTACDRVASALAAVGVPAARQLLGTGSGTNTLGIVVGRWREVHGEIAALVIAHGPSTGGVYAHFAGPADGTLELLNSRGHVGRRLGAGAGLIAATNEIKSVPTWFVTGTDAAGVFAAASAMTARRLRDHLALAVQGPRDLPVPQP